MAFPPLNILWISKKDQLSSLLLSNKCWFPTIYMVPKEEASIYLGCIQDNLCAGYSIELDVWDSIQYWHSSILTSLIYTFFICKGRRVG